MADNYKLSIQKALGNIAQVAQRKLGQTINTVSNYRATPQSPTLGKSVQSAWNNNLFNFMTKADTGFSPLDQTFRAGGQAAKGVLEGMTFNAMTIPAKRPQNRLETGANIAGNIYGAFSPIGFGAKVLAPVGKGTEMAVTRLLPKASKLARVAPVIAGEAAQTGAIGGLRGISNQEFNPVEDFAYGLGFRGALGTAAKALSPKLSGIKKADPRIDNLLNSGTRLRQMGYSEDQIKRISAKEAGELIKNNVPPFTHRTFNTKTPQMEGFTGEQAEQALLRAEYEGGVKKDVFNKIFSKWVGKREVARTTGVEIGSKFRNIPTKEGPDVIRVIENPDAHVSIPARQSAKSVREEFDRLYADAQKEGLDIKYLQNYITHIWDRPVDEVAQMYKGASQKFKFSQNRVLPTYEEGLKMGLKPKYTNPSQIIAEYGRKLEETKANVELIKELKSQGLVIPSSVGSGRPGFTALTGPGFPRSVSMGPDGRVYQGYYYAPTEIAEQLNRVFSSPDSTFLSRAAGIGAKTSSFVQDVTMSAGVPKTPLNSWTFAQATKEILAGRVISPISAILRSSVGNSDEFFRANAGQIKKMQMRNIPVQTTLNVENLPDRGALKNMFGDNAGELWHKVMNEPTFKKFMPQLQIHLFNDVERSMLRAGKDPEVAADIAAKAVKNFYGITGTDTLAKRSQLGKDALGTIFFAPRYRESMINFWWNTVKGFKNPFSPENIYNTRFAIGATLTLGIMNYLNEQTMGHPMWENPKSHRDKWLIPVGDGNIIGVPFLSSIATMPRFAAKMASNLATLDFEEAGKEGKTLLSSSLRPVVDVFTNENYFGQEIYNPEGTQIDKAKQIGSFLAGAYTHPYIRAGIEAGAVPGIPAKDQPWYATTAKALEMPIRFTTEKKLKSGYYYDTKEEALHGLTADERKQAEILFTPESKGGFDSETEAMMMIKTPKLIEVKKKIALQSNPNDPLYSRPIEDIKGFLAYQATDDSDFATKAAIRIKYPWIPQVQYLNTIEMYKLLKDTDKAFELKPPTPLQRLQPEQVKIASLYTAMPKGDPRKKVLLASNPWLRQYWDSNSAYYNQYPYEQTGALAEYLASENIALPSSSYGSTGYRARARKGKKIAIKNFKSKKIKLKKVKFAALKKDKAPKKLKISKSKTFKMPKIT